MSEELSALREEVARLRRDLEEIRQQIGETGNPEPGQPRYHYSTHYLRTQSIEVYDDHVGPKVEIYADEESAGIYLVDKGGNLRGKLEIGKQGVALSIIGEEGKAVVGVSAPQDHGQVFVASPDGVGRAVMRSTQLGGAVNVLQASGEPGVYLLAQADGGKLEVISKNARSAVSAYADETGCGVVRVHESSGETMACLAATSESGIMTTFGHLGEEAVILCGTDTGGRVLVCDVHGAMMATFPLPLV